MEVEEEEEEGRMEICMSCCNMNEENSVHSFILESGN
jgi:hypothetical protein